ncbi:hypothetical protein VKT23_011542 [Stygiomarasmius scandens]|uniref:Aminoglycoside phosphotransferase domain-containing protein n=1 Tax=Marasmiellus scandens TaxID=2682957 RepID=A0ABR1JDM5_9AGAR
MLSPDDYSPDSAEEYDSDEYSPLEPNFPILYSRVSEATGRQIISSRKLTRGRYHEIFILSSSDGWSCIARFARCTQSEEKIFSEVATMQYVRAHSTIPVPEIYLFDASSENEIGMQYIVMQRIEGKHLYSMWDDLPIEHQKAVLEEIASVLTKLSDIKFDKIGSLSKDGTVGPLLRGQGIQIDGVDSVTTVCSGPFMTSQDFLMSFLSSYASEPLLEDVVEAVKDVVNRYCISHSEASFIRPPFRLIHADFDGQNMLFSDPALTNGAPPMLKGIIDWEYAYVGPLYFLYEYPIFVQDVSWSKEYYARNLVLRQHFVRALQQKFSPDSEQWEEVKQCFPAAKCSTMNEYNRLLMAGYDWDLETLKRSLEEYVKGEREGTGKPYTGRMDWTPDGEV